LVPEKSNFAASFTGSEMKSWTSAIPAANMKI
jgi:hypothetical protein